MSEFWIEDFTTELAAADYVARFRDAERFGACCRACPRYGRQWACPPFGFDVEEYLAAYPTALLIATKIVPATTRTDDAVGTGGRMLREARRRLDARLLDMERRFGGRAFFAGSCHLCPEDDCTRPQDKPCRHADRIRPSLEACGLDIGRTTAELLGIELKWGTEGCLPEYFTLVSGFFHASTRVVWER